MPTPVGHALAGLAIAWLSTAKRGQAPFSATPLTAACVALAVAPDLDLLVGWHRGPSHSLVTAAVIGLTVGVLARWRGQAPGLFGWSAFAAWGSHVALDWLGRDQSPPHGIMALWPVSHDYWVSGLGLFAEVSRRYWLPDQFIVGNSLAVAREIAIIGPVVLAAWAWRRRAQAASPDQGPQP